MIKWAVNTPANLQFRRLDFDAGTHVG
jgi:hypothetical protein